MSPIFLNLFSCSELKICSTAGSASQPAFPAQPPPLGGGGTRMGFFWRGFLHIMWFPAQPPQGCLSKALLRTHKCQGTSAWSPQKKSSSHCPLPLISLKSSPSFFLFFLSFLFSFFLLKYYLWMDILFGHLDDIWIFACHCNSFFFAVYLNSNVPDCQESRSARDTGQVCWHWELPVYVPDGALPHQGFGISQQRHSSHCSHFPRIPHLLVIFQKQEKYLS